MAKTLTEAGSNVPDATIKKHVRLITALKVNLESVQGEYRAAVKAAKGAGMNTGQLLAAMAAKKREPEDVQRDLEQYLRYCDLVGVGLQMRFDLFGGTGSGGEEAEEDSGGRPAVGPGDPERIEHETWEAHAAGQKAGAGGLTKETCPHAEGTYQFTAWREGWMVGQATLLPSADGAKRASPRRTRAAPTAH